MAATSRCRDCDMGLRAIDGEWIAEDDTACCAGRGEWGEEWPHRPLYHVQHVPGGPDLVIMEKE